MLQYMLEISFKHTVSLSFLFTASCFIADSCSSEFYFPEGSKGLSKFLDRVISSPKVRTTKMSDP